MAKQSFTRQKVAKDTEVIGEGMAMLSSSEKPIQLGDVLYRASFNSYDPEYSVTAHRVIQLNYKYRSVRVRCAKGCEESINFDEGCSRSKYYHTLDEVKKDLQEKIDEAIDDVQNDIDKYERKKVRFKTLIANTKALKSIKIPARV